MLNFGSQPKGNRVSGLDAGCMSVETVETWGGIMTIVTPQTNVVVKLLHSAVALGYDKVTDQIVLCLSPKGGEFGQPNTWLMVVDDNLPSARNLLSAIGGAGAIRLDPFVNYKLRKSLSFGATAKVHLAERPDRTGRL